MAVRGMPRRMPRTSQRFQVSGLLGTPPALLLLLLLLLLEAGDAEPWPRKRGPDALVCNE